jgi:hypothetical protein
MGWDNMRLLGYHIAKRKKLDDLTLEIIGQQIYNALSGSNASDEKIMQDFKKFYIFYQIVNLLENRDTIEITQDVWEDLSLSEEEFRVSLHGFYKTIQGVNKLEKATKAKINQGLSAEIVWSKHNLLNQVRFTKVY